MNNLEKTLIKYIIKCIQENKKTSEKFNKALGLSNRIATVETIFSENVSNQWDELLDILFPKEFGEQDASDGSNNTELDIAYNLLCECIYGNKTADDLIQYLIKHKVLSED